MSEPKQQRQTTLFSFFSQPSKKKKRDESSLKKSKDKQTLKTKKTKPSKPTSSEVDSYSQPSATTRGQAVLVATAVSPLDSSKATAAQEEINHRHRKRPRPKPSTIKTEMNCDPQDEESSVGQRKVQLREDSIDGEMKENIVNYQQQDVVSAPTIIPPMPKSDQSDESEAMMSSDDENENSEENENNGMSAYELLRQRNIERNNARLASLGLLSHNMGSLSSSSQPKKPRRKTPSKPTKAAPSIPIRRSTRARKSVLSDSAETVSSALKNSNLELSSDQVVEAAVEQEEEETYTVSPLVQYAMSSSVAINASERPCGNYTPIVEPTELSSSSSYSLHPIGPRLAPPKGLKAIYSLDFFQKVSSESSSGNASWLVGAGKAGIVALWDCRQAWNGNDDEGDDMIDPTLTWKAHNGRWIAEARFLPTATTTSSSPTQSLAPSRLVTAANDGKVCLWDLSTVSVRSGVPKLLSQSGGELHTSGIFAMDVLANPATSETTIATGSKDKTVALSKLENDCSVRPIWNSNVHTAKVGAVRLHPTRRSILASASDDNLVCVHDCQCGEKGGMVVQLENVHNRPHSVVWDPYHSDMFMTAGLDQQIKLWDIRSTNEPIVVLQGHIPENLARCKRIHHPAFYYPQGNNGGAAFVLSGGERSQALSMFHHYYPDVVKEDQPKDTSHRLYSRGKLPVDCGDAGCIAVNHDKVAVSVQDGEILILAPSGKKKQ